jgi:hypothetical protein
MVTNLWLLAVVEGAAETFERGVELGHRDEDMAAVYFAARGRPDDPRIPR